ncbi:unnamed protein product [Paramecium pentaurelia]|uniref:Uncharacterized protein n=1 Tax=Paramecium pentaurelia TaxID=43138 RepID=A0A8S1T1M0_9CILI|nr:unnamed protein product [Paramecium pentaurelia]
MVISKNVKLVCFDESCKGERLYCIQCIKNGINVSHPQYQEELPKLFVHIQSIEKECDDVINRMNIQMDLLQQEFYLLFGGISSKYQISKQQFLNLNSQQMNSYLEQSVHFRSFEFKIIQLLQQFKNEFQFQIQKLLHELQLSELSYYQISNLYLTKSEELYQKGYKLRIQDNSKDKKHYEVIIIFDQALSLNSKHQKALLCKADSLRSLCQYDDAIILEIKLYKQIQSIVFHYVLKVLIIFVHQRCIIHIKIPFFQFTKFIKVQRSYGSD